MKPIKPYSEIINFHLLSIGFSCFSFIVPNPTDLTSINLDWNKVLGAANYYIYRSSSYIWSVDGLVPIAIISSTDYIDTIPSEGFYYYVVVAGNYVGTSSCSNCQYIEYKLLYVQEYIIISSIIVGSFISLTIVMKTRKKN